MTSGGAKGLPMVASLNNGAFKEGEEDNYLEKTKNAGI